ncbi:MAG: alpha-glucan family phosphorylase [Fidelibacterota bacterium]
MTSTESQIKIAYFSAEIGISSSLPTYSGGLGVLAGDHIKAATDEGLPFCAITLLYKEGYFKQRIDEKGNQSETYPKFDPEPLLTKLDFTFPLHLRDRNVQVEVFRLDYKGLSGHTVPIYFMDTDLDSNTEEDRIISLRLYSGNKDHRIMQEAILGFGGIHLLKHLGILENIETFHMNEGHCSFLTLGLLDKFKDEQVVRKKCHFTTHTPVAAGHDHFSVKRVKNLLHDLIPENLELPSLVQNSRLHMTELGLYFSRSANGVSELHGKVAQNQFPQFKIGHITNGVYHPYWVCPQYRELFDDYLPGWRQEGEKLLNLDSIPDEKLLVAHANRKRTLLGYANAQVQKALSRQVLTIGFARRAATYKRAHLLFSDMDRFIKLSHGKVQFVFAGKAHPKDDQGKSIIREVVANSNKLYGKVKVIFLENYNMWLGRLITSGVDIWLNTPLRPNEASGTSGMKAALNGVPNLSVLDGWWAEGCDHGINGWAIGNPDTPDDEADANHLYELLENEIIPLYYGESTAWINIMKASIKTGVQFTALRMIRDYQTKYY